MPNPSLSLTSSTRFSIVGTSSPNALMPVRLCAALHVVVELDAKEIAPRTSKIGRLQGKARRPECAAERILLAGLAIVLIRHVLHGNRAHVVLHVLVEQQI